MRLIVLLLFVGKLSAQTIKPTTVQKLKLPIDTVIEMNGQKIRLSKANGSDHLINIQRVADASKMSAMPNALNGFKDAQPKISNNGKGFDVHQSTVDNMPILKPDAQNLSTLTYKIKRLPQTEGSGCIEVTEETPLQNFKYYKPLTDKEKKLLELFKSK